MNASADLLGLHIAESRFATFGEEFSDGDAFLFLNLRIDIDKRPA